MSGVWQFAVTEQILHSTQVMIFDIDKRNTDNPFNSSLLKLNLSYGLSMSFHKESTLKSGFCILPRIFILTVKGCYGCCKDKVTWDSLRGSSTSAADTQVAFGMCEWDRVGGVWGVCVCGAPVLPKRHSGHIYASPLIDLFPCLLYNLACFFCLLMPW